MYEWTFLKPLLHLLSAPKSFICSAVYSKAGNVNSGACKISLLVLYKEKLETRLLVI